MKLTKRLSYFALPAIYEMLIMSIAKKLTVLQRNLTMIIDNAILQISRLFTVIPTQTDRPQAAGHIVDVHWVNIYLTHQLLR